MRILQGLASQRRARCAWVEEENDPMRILQETAWTDGNCAGRSVEEENDPMRILQETRRSHQKTEKHAVEEENDPMRILQA